jgi:hypothetical protein
VWVPGDYWPGESESLLANMGEEARLAGKKGKGAHGPTPTLSCLQMSRTRL